MKRLLLLVAMLVVSSGILAAAKHTDITSAVNQTRKFFDGTNGGALYLGNLQAVKTDCSTDYRTTTARLIAKGCATTGDIVLGGETNIAFYALLGKTTAGAVQYDCTLDLGVKSTGKYWVPSSAAAVIGTTGAGHIWTFYPDDTNQKLPNIFFATTAVPGLPSFDMARLRCHSNKPSGSDKITFLKVSLIDAYR